MATAFPPASSWRSRDSLPSSFMGPSTANARRPRATAARVLIAGFAYCPTTAVVRAGEQLSWTNADSAAHTVTARGGAFDSGTLAHGDSWSLPTLRPGMYDYFCRIHPWMRGQLTVSG